MWPCVTFSAWVLIQKPYQLFGRLPYPIVMNNTLRNLPFIKDFIEGKGGSPSRERFGFTTINTGDGSTAFFFGLAAAANLRYAIPFFIEGVSTLYREWSFWNVAGVAMGAFWMWVGYGFTRTFFYCIGIQSKKKV